MAFFFRERKKQVELRNCLRRLLDTTSPNLPPLEGDCRSDDRHNRTLPVLLVPWEDGGPVVNEASVALTKDFSDLGMALVLQQPFRAEQVVVAFRMASDPQREGGSTLYFMLGRLRQNTSTGGGFWQLGILLEELLNQADCPQLKPLVPLTSSLLPSAADQSRQPAESLR